MRTTFGFRSFALPSNATAIALLLFSATPTAAAEPGTRVFGSATAAVMGGIVAGPVGLVAGAVIGYMIGPSLTGGSIVPRRRVARRVVRRVPVAQAEPQVPPQIYGQAMYPQANYGQPIYLAQQVPAPGQTGMPAQPGAFLPPQAAATAPAPYLSPSIANRPAMYAPVPVPMQLAPSGNYAAHAYRPKDGSQTPDPVH